MERSVWFVLNVRFPTEKAYGTTTSRTARAINEIPGLKSVVITPNFDSTQEQIVETLEVKMPFDNLYKKCLNSKKFSKIAFNIWKFPFLLKVLIKLRNRKGIFWMRDIPMSLISRMFGHITICEVHRSPSNISKQLLRVLSNASRCTFVFISKDLYKKIGINVKSHVFFGMAVDADELRSQKRREFNKDFTVGYLGASHSSGNSLSLQPLIEAAKLATKLNLSVKFQILGIQEREINLKFVEDRPSNLEFLGRVSRSEIFNYIDGFDVGLVLYPDTPYFQDSFPIKIVEYSARRIAILASDTKAHREILGEKLALYFDPYTPSQIIEKIEFLQKNPRKMAEMVESAFKWVSNLTYQNRASEIMQTALAFETKKKNSANSDT